MWPQVREAKECQQPKETSTIVKHTRRILIELSVIVIAIRLLGESPKYTNSFYMEILRGKKKEAILELRLLYTFHTIWIILTKKLCSKLF